MSSTMGGIGLDLFVGGTRLQSVPREGRRGATCRLLYSPWSMYEYTEPVTRSVDQPTRSRYKETAVTCQRQGKGETVNGSWGALGEIILVRITASQPMTGSQCMMTPPWPMRHMPTIRKFYYLFLLTVNKTCLNAMAGNNASHVFSTLASKS